MNRKHYYLKSGISWWEYCNFGAIISKTRHKLFWAEVFKNGLRHRYFECWEQISYFHVWRTIGSHWFLSTAAVEPLIGMCRVRAFKRHWYTGKAVIARKQNVIMRGKSNANVEPSAERTATDSSTPIHLLSFAVLWA